MTHVGKVYDLFYSPLEGRTSSDTLQFDPKGIVDDKHYNKKVERSVLLTSLESYALLEEHGIKAVHGSLGENLLLDYNPYALTTGTRLKIGNVELEISQLCTLCKSLVAVDAKVPKLLKDDRGIFAKVIRSGIIRRDDSIYILN